MYVDLIQVVPKLAPNVTGVGDHALQLAAALRDQYGINTQFLVADPSWTGDFDVGFRVSPLKHLTADALFDHLHRVTPTATAVILHYVGYGFEKRGCPFWLAKGLEHWRIATGSNVRLLTMFHELYASGPPWRSSFWTSPLQQWILKRLARVSDQCRTNLAGAARVIDRLAPHQRGRVCIQPVFSNVGELTTPSPSNQRKPWLVIFGSTGWLESSFLGNRHQLLRICRRFCIEKIFLIGKWNQRLPDFGVPADAVGALPGSEVSSLMSQAQVGFTSYPVHCLGKSTIFAAYAAHGLIPFVAQGGNNEDGLICGETFLTANTRISEPDWQMLRGIAGRVYSWYVPHCLRETAASYARQLTLSSTAGYGTTAPYVQPA